MTAYMAAARPVMDLAAPTGFLRQDGMFYFDTAQAITFETAEGALAAAHAALDAMSETAKALGLFAGVAVRA